MFTIIIFGILFAGFIGLYVYATQYENKIEQRFRVYAGSVGATFYKGSARDSGLQSLLINEELTTYIRYGLMYDDGTVIGQGNLTTRSNDTQEGKYSFGVSFKSTSSESGIAVLFNFASFPLTKYPSLWLVVDSRKNNMLGRSLMDTADVREKLQPISLEGNFPDTYKVYMNSNQQIDALTALNPASMAKLLDIFSRYDMEICAGRVYLYTAGTSTFYDPNVREPMLADVRALAQIFA